TPLPFGVEQTAKCRGQGAVGTSCTISSPESSTERVFEPRTPTTITSPAAAIWERECSPGAVAAGAVRTTRHDPSSTSVTGPSSSPATRSAFQRRRKWRGPLPAGLAERMGHGRGANHPPRSQLHFGDGSIEFPGDEERVSAPEEMAGAAAGRHRDEDGIRRRAARLERVDPQLVGAEVRDDEVIVDDGAEVG